MNENKIYINKKDEKAFVAFIFDLMYNKPVHAGIEFANFSLHFDGSDDIEDQKTLIVLVTDYISSHGVVPCLITLNDMGLTISNIAMTEYASEKIVPDIEAEVPNTETNAEELKPEPTGDLIMSTPEADMNDENKNYTFTDVLAVLQRICSNGPQQIWRIGGYNVMEIPCSNPPDTKRYAFSDKDNIVHYMVYKYDESGTLRCIISTSNSNLNVRSDNAISDHIWLEDNGFMNFLIILCSMK